MTGPHGSGRTVVIGVGNDFRRDDGVAWRVIGRLRERAARQPLPPGTDLRECDGDPGRLIGLWEGAELAVVVDAAHAHPPSPGRVHRLELDRRRLWRNGAASSHGLGWARRWNSPGRWARCPPVSSYMRWRARTARWAPGCPLPSPRPWNPSICWRASS